MCTVIASWNSSICNVKEGSLLEKLGDSWEDYWEEGWDSWLGDGPNWQQHVSPQGLELETPSLVPVKKNASTVVVSDKYNLKPIPLKRQRYGPCCRFLNTGSRGESDVIDYSSSHSATTAPGDAAPPAEKKYKPLNTTPNATKEIKVKIIPPQRESEAGNTLGIGSKLFSWECMFWEGKVFCFFPLLLFLLAFDFLVSFNACTSGIPFS